MIGEEHPLRRSWSRELALGIAVAIVAAWLLLGRSVLDRERRPTAVPHRDDAQADARERMVDAPFLAAVGTRAPLGETNEPTAERDPPGSTSPSEPAVVVRGSVDDPGFLEVLVLDASGRPAPGVPLRVDIETLPRSSGPPALSTSTDAEGRALLPRDSLTGDQLRTPRIRVIRTVLRAIVPLREPPTLELGPPLPASRSVTLFLPATGRVLVQVSADDGTPVVDGATVYASVHHRSGKSSSCNAPVRDGLAEFPWIDVGTRLELRAVYDDQRSGPSSRAHATLSGPAWPEETVEATLALGPEFPVLTFRVTDERGRALAWANLDVLVSEEPLSPQHSKCVADGEGRAELLVLGQHLSTGLRALELTMSQPTKRGALLVLPPELERTGPTDLGTIVLRPAR